MPISSIFVGVALALLVAPFVAGPLVKNSRGRRPPRVEAEPASPETVKQTALAALRDLDFDYRTGKITEEDYAPLRQGLLVEAARAAQAVDAQRPALDDEIEAAVRALRGAKSSGAGCTCPKCQAPARAGDKFCPSCGAALGPTCPACHAPVQATDQFCSHCGKILRPEATAVL